MAEPREVFNDLVRLEIELWNAVDAALRDEADLPLSWFEHLSVIAGRPCCRIADLIGELGITHGGASKVVSRLVEAGLCARVPHPQDGRSACIEPTDQGRARLVQADAVLDATLGERMAALLPSGELEGLATTLRRLRPARYPDPDRARAG